MKRAFRRWAEVAAESRHAKVTLATTACWVKHRSDRNARAVLLAWRIVVAQPTIDAAIYVQLERKCKFFATFFFLPGMVPSSQPRDLVVVEQISKRRSQRLIC